MANIKHYIFKGAVFFISIAFLNGQLIAPALSSPELPSGIVSGASSSNASSNSTLAVVPDQSMGASSTSVKDKDNKHIVATTLESIFKADDTTIWNILIDFSKYPAIFKRIKSVEITKRDGSFVYTESYLKPQLFVKQTIQHIVNDLSAGPTILKWNMIDGNFKYLTGKWELQSRSPNTCAVKYTLYVDLGPIVPAALINFVVHYMQQEIVNDLKRYVETQYKQQEKHKVASKN